MGASRADVSHLQLATTPEPHAPANPYVFSYQAGRAPGHVDRQHTEVSDGSGVIRGAFSYVDPKNQVRTVQYVADENGFHPQLSHQLEDSEAVKAAKRKHFAAYNRIAQEHASHTPGQAVSMARHEPISCKLYIVHNLILYFHSTCSRSQLLPMAALPSILQPKNT